MNYIEWAKKLVAFQGPDEARRIAKRNTVAFWEYDHKERGKQHKQRVYNSNLNFYTQALCWINKHFPAAAKC